MNQQSKLVGYALVLLASLLWGVSATCAQFLFHERSLTPEWLVTTRLLISGVILLTIPLVKKPRSVIEPWTNKKDVIELLFFGIFGMLAIQYTYFAAIKHSNAATATILQYLGPVFIACYYVIRNKRLPIMREMVAIGLATLGTFLIVTHGSLESFTISGLALFWGITSAVALGVYSISPIRLISKHDPSVIVGWGMMIGGVSFSLFFSPWSVPGVWDLATFLFAGFVILFGSALAFYCYLVSVQIIGATIASVLACAEPLAAAVLAVVWLQVPFGIYDWVGAVCIISTIGLLTRKS